MAEYIQSLAITGGAKRLRAFLGEENASAEDCARIHVRKTELFAAEISRRKANAGLGDNFCQEESEDAVLRVRPGLVPLLRAAKAAGVPVGLCALTEDAVVEALLDAFELRELFDVYIVQSDRRLYADKPKPDGACYQYVAGKLLVLAGDHGDGDELLEKNIVALEDTAISLQSPVSAGIAVPIALPSEWAVDQDFSAAAIRLREVTDILNWKTMLTDEDVNFCVKEKEGVTSESQQLFGMKNGQQVVQDRKPSPSDVDRELSNTSTTDSTQPAAGAATKSISASINADEEQKEEGDQEKLGRRLLASLSDFVAVARFRVPKQG
eukprot:g9721.t1